MWLREPQPRNPRRWSPRRKAWLGVAMTAPREGAIAREHELETPPRGAPIERGHIMLPRETPQEGVVGASECRPTRRDSTERRPDWPSKKGATERTQSLQEMPLEGTPTALEKRGTCKPKQGAALKGDTQAGGVWRPEERARQAKSNAQQDTPGRQNPSQSGGTTSETTYIFLCLHHFPPSIPRANCRPSAKSLVAKDDDDAPESPLVGSVTLPSRAVTRVLIWPKKPPFILENILQQSPTVCEMRGSGCGK